MVWWGYKTGENLCIPPSACFLFLELENTIFNQSCVFYPHPFPSPRLILAFSSRVSPLPSSLVSCGDGRRVTMLFHCNHRLQLFCLHLVRNVGELSGILQKKYQENISKIQKLKSR